MKKGIFISAGKLMITATILFVTIAATAQSTTKDKRLVEDAVEAKEDFIHTDGLMKG